MTDPYFVTGDNATQESE